MHSHIFLQELHGYSFIAIRRFPNSSWKMLVPPQGGAAPLLNGQDGAWLCEHVSSASHLAARKQPSGNCSACVCGADGPPHVHPDSFL